MVPVVDVESGRRRFRRRRFFSGVWKKGWHPREAAGVGRAWEAHRRGFALAAAASNARATASLAIDVQGDAGSEQAAATLRRSAAQVQYTVEIPPSAAKTADSRPEPTRKSLLDEEEGKACRERVRDDDEATIADDVSVRSEREKAASVMSVAMSMLDSRRRG